MLKNAKISKQIESKEAMNNNFCVEKNQSNHSPGLFQMAVARDAAGQPGHESGRVDQILSRVGSGRVSKFQNCHGSGRVTGQPKIFNGSDGSSKNL